MKEEKEEEVVVTEIICSLRICLKSFPCVIEANKAMTIDMGTVVTSVEDVGGRGWNGAPGNVLM